MLDSEEHQRTRLTNLLESSPVLIPEYNSVVLESPLMYLRKVGIYTQGLYNDIQELSLNLADPRPRLVLALLNRHSFCLDSPGIQSESPPPWIGRRRSFAGAHETR